MHEVFVEQDAVDLSRCTGLPCQHCVNSFLDPRPERHERADIVWCDGEVESGRAHIGVPAATVSDGGQRAWFDTGEVKVRQSAPAGYVLDRDIIGRAVEAKLHGDNAR